jgi:hypothetical protein
MARTNIEQRLFGDSRLRYFQKLMQWQLREAVGCLACLWNASQELEATRATSKQVGAWADSDPKELPQLLAALIESGFLKSEGEDSYYIVGNPEQIEGIRGCRNRTQKATEALRKKREADAHRNDHRNDVRDDDVTSTSRERNDDVNESQLQLQVQVHKKEKKRSSPSARARSAEPTAGSVVFEAYQIALEAKGFEKTPRNAKDASICKRLVEKYGAKDSEGLVRHFVESLAPKEFLGLDYLLKSADRYWQELRTGRDLKAPWEKNQNRGQSVSDQNAATYQLFKGGRNE